jgi:hypothetical protein
MKSYKIKNMKAANQSSENFANVMYFGAIVTKKNYIHEDIKSRLNSNIENYTLPGIHSCEMCFLTLKKNISSVSGTRAKLIQIMNNLNAS